MMIRSALLAVGLWAGCGGDLFKQPNLDLCIAGCDEADMSRPKERRFGSFRRSVTLPSPLWIGATKISCCGTQARIGSRASKGTLARI